MTLIGMREWADLDIRVSFKLPEAGAAARRGEGVLVEEARDGERGERGERPRDAARAERREDGAVEEAADEHVPPARPKVGGRGRRRQRRPEGHLRPVAE